MTYATIVTLVFLSLCIQTARADTILTVTVPQANVRSEPVVDDQNLITTALEGHELRELDRDGDWVLVEIVGSGGRRGWIHKNLVYQKLDPGCRGDIEGEKSEKQGAILWYSSYRRLATNRICFQRVVEIPEEPFQYLVNWPVASMNSQIVDRYFSLEKGLVR